MKTLMGAALATGILTALTTASLPQPASAASFDCARADLAADERAICETRALNDADVKMATTFDILTSLLAMGNRDKLHEEQASWLKKRKACEADATCLKAAYDERMKQLDEAFKGLSKPL